MKTLWILYLIACPNCEWEIVKTYEMKCSGWECASNKWNVIESYDTLRDCRRAQEEQERIREGIGYWNDSARFECMRK